MTGIVPAGLSLQEEEAWKAEMTATLRRRAVAQLDLLRTKMVADCLTVDEEGNGIVPFATKLAVVQHIAKSTPVENVSKVAEQPSVAVRFSFYQPPT